MKEFSKSFNLASGAYEIALPLFGEYRAYFTDEAHQRLKEYAERDNVFPSTEEGLYLTLAKEVIDRTWEFLAERNESPEFIDFNLGRGKIIVECSQQAIDVLKTRLGNMFADLTVSQLAKNILWENLPITKAKPIKLVLTGTHLHPSLMFGRRI